MDDQKLRRLGWGWMALSLLLLAGSIATLVLGYEDTPPVALQAFNTIPYRAIFALSISPILIVGALIVSKQPRNLYGWLWLTLGFGFAVQELSTAYAMIGMVLKPGSLPLAGVALNLAGVAWFLAFCTMPSILLRFPTGRPLSPRWGLAEWVIGAGFACVVLIGWGASGESGFIPVENPYALPGRMGELVLLIVNIAAVTVAMSILLGIISVIVRYYRASGVERQQIKWFAFGAALFGIYLAVDGPTELPGAWEAVKEAFSFMMLPATIGIAMLRHHLFDIDLIIRRTVTYSAITALLAAVYFGAVTLLQDAFTGFIGSESPLAVVISTLAMAAMFTPLRRRVQTFIDRRFNRSKYNAEKTLETFAETMRDEVDIDHLSAALLGVVEETMQPQSVGLWMAKEAHARDKAHE